MYSLLLRCGAREKDLLVAELWERGTTGVLEAELPSDVWELRAFFDETFPLETLPQALAWRDEGSPDWSDGWRQAWEPLPVGERLLLLPAWMQPPEEHAARAIVRIRPGQASGTGHHPPTQLALQALETFLRPDDSVLDVGVGSGILLTAADALGAGALYGCEIDPIAARIARDNLDADGIRAGIWIGSPRSLRTGSVTLVAANLNGVTIDTLRHELARVLKQGGRLILSGFTERWRERLEMQFERLQMTRLARLEQERWRALVFSSAR